MVGYRVQVKGRYGKWTNLGLYCDMQAAQFYLSMFPNRTYRVVEEQFNG